jgi:hypothetical protein
MVRKLGVLKGQKATEMNKRVSMICIFKVLTKSTSLWVFCFVLFSHLHRGQSSSVFKGRRWHLTGSPLCRVGNLKSHVLIVHRNITFSQRISKINHSSWTLTRWKTLSWEFIPSAAIGYGQENSIHAFN